MGTARRQFTGEFKREAVGLLASQRPAVEPDCPGAGDCPLRGSAPGGTGVTGGMRDRRGASICRRRSRMPMRIWRLKTPALRRENERLRMEREILKKTAAHFLGSAEMKFRLIADQRETFPVRVMCDVMGVSPAGYYAWRGRPESHRKVGQPCLAGRDPSGPCGTSRAIWRGQAFSATLRAEGRPASRGRVERLMRHHGVTRPRMRRQFRMRTTDSRHDLPITPNLLEQKFVAERPNQVWLADITHTCPTGEGWLYLAVVLDLFTRKIVGWAMRDHMRAELTIAALTMAIQRQKPPPGPDPPFRSRQSIRRRRLPQGSRRSRDDPIHEPEGKLLGQCTDRKLLRHSEN